MVQITIKSSPVVDEVDFKVEDPGTLIEDHNGQVYMVIVTPGKLAPKLMRLSSPSGYYNVSHVPPYRRYKGAVTIQN